MTFNELLTDLFDRLAEHIYEAVEGLDARVLSTSPAPGTNPIGWLIWHLTRVQDHHIAEILEQEQVWVSGDWGPRFGVASDPHNTGYGHDDKDVRAIRAESADVLTEYYAAVAARTSTLLNELTAKDLNRVVDRRWNPPVTLGVRLISIADDDIQHAGQALYVRGLLTAA
jgi:uncharacterized damage-inducible protein DinB